jgi:hypothetical protein
MTKDDLLDLIERYCIRMKIREYKAYKIVLKQHDDINILQLVIIIKDNCIVNVSYINDIYDYLSTYRKIPIVKIIRSELLSELLKND